MNILNYLKSLLPSFKRGSVESDARQLIQLAKKAIQPAFKRLAGVMAGKPFTSPLGVRVEADVRKAMGVSAGTAAPILLTAFTALVPKLEYILQVIDEEFEPDVSRDNMTYKQGTILRYLELVRFGMEYSMRMGTRLVAAEARHQLNRSAEIDSQLTPAEIKWFDANYKSWLQALGLIATPLLSLRQAIDKMPDVVIVPATAAADAQTAGAHRLDPLQLGFINTSSLAFNFIYHFRLMKSELEADALRAREREAQVLELRILELQQAYGQTQDPKLQQQIEYHTGRLQTLRVKIAQEIEKFGL